MLLLSILCSEIAMIHINWTPGKKVLRTFGISIIATIVVIGMIGFAYEWFSLKIALAIGTPTVLSGAIVIAFPVSTISKSMYHVWTLPALLIGSVMSVVIVSVVYYLVLTPTGIILRIVGHDSLMIKEKRKSYWVDSKDIEEVGDFERQF